jgi:hypothetical protein
MSNPVSRPTLNKRHSQTVPSQLGTLSDGGIIGSASERKHRSRHASREVADPLAPPPTIPLNAPKVPPAPPPPAGAPASSAAQHVAHLGHQATAGALLVGGAAAEAARGSMRGRMRALGAKSMRTDGGVHPCCGFVVERLSASAITIEIDNARGERVTLKLVEDDEYAAMASHTDHALPSRHSVLSAR